MSAPAETGNNERPYRTQTVTSQHCLSSVTDVPPLLVIMAAWAWRIIAVCAASVLIGWMLLKVSLLLVSLLVALLLAVISEPLNSFLRNKLHWPPAAAAGVTLLSLLLIIGAMLGGSGTGIYQGFQALGDNVLGGINTIFEWSADMFSNLQFPNLQERITNARNDIEKLITGNSTRILGGVLNVGSSLTSFFAGLVLTFFALFFFLKDGRRLWHWFVRLLPAEYRTSANEAGIRAWVTIGNYARTQAIVALADAAGIAIFAAALKTPLSLVFPIAALVFLGAFIPIVGALISGSIAVIVVFMNTGSFVMALIMLAGVLLVQQVEGHLLQPILQGNALNMHALAIVLLVAGGTAIGGITGALFTVPLAAAVNTMVLYLSGHDIYPYLDNMPNRPGGPKKDFAEYANEYWDNFDHNVVQHLSPKAARRANRLRRATRARGADYSSSATPPNSCTDSPSTHLQNHQGPQNQQNHQQNSKQATS